MSLIPALTELGLNEKEIKLYLTLLKKGRLLPSALSKLTKINRATVYSVAKSLQSKGLVREDLSGKSRFLIASPPSQLEHSLLEQKEELASKERLVKEITRELSLLTAEEQYPVPKLQFIQEADLEQFLFSNLRKWQQSILATDNVWWGFQDHTFVEHYESWIHSTWTTPEGKDPSFQGKVISNVSGIEHKLENAYPKSKRDIRFIADMNFTSTVWVAGEFLVMVMTQHHPFYLFEIHDATLAHNMREVLKKLWKKGTQKNL